MSPPYRATSDRPGNAFEFKVFSEYIDPAAPTSVPLIIAVLSWVSRFSLCYIDSLTYIDYNVKVMQQSHNTPEQKLFGDRNLQIIFAMTLTAVLGVASITPVFPEVVRQLFAIHICYNDLRIRVG